MSLSAVHSVIKRNSSKEIQKIWRHFCAKGHVRKSIFYACDLQALRQLCIINGHDSVIEITIQAQEDFQK